MSALTEARTKLLAASAVTSLLGGEHVYPQRVPKNVNPQPERYIVLQTISDLADNHLEGWSGLDDVLLQMACIAPSWDVADAIRRAARDAVTGSDSYSEVTGAQFKSRAVDARDIYLPDIHRHELQQDIAISFRDS